MRLAIDATPILSGGKGLAIFLGTFLDGISCSRALRPMVVYVDESFFDEARGRWSELPLKAVRSRPALLWEKTLLPRQIRRDGAELLFTGRDRTVCEPVCKTVVYLFEVPDYRTELTLRGGDGWYSKAAAVVTRRSFTSVAGRVSHFIVSSESTRRDLETRYAVPSKKVTVVYPGVRPQFHGRGDSKCRGEATRFFTAGNPYVLHFATGDPRDNTSTALEAFSRALPYLNRGVVLLLAGVSEKSRTVVERRVARYGLRGRVHVAGFLEGESLSLAYQGAEAYLDPTLYEGFGFQLLEAMACGVPILSSRVTSIPEVVSDAGLLFDPYDVEGFAFGLGKIIGDPGLRESMISKGLDRAKLFSWESTVRQLVDVIEAVARQDRRRA